MCRGDKSWLLMRCEEEGIVLVVLTTVQELIRPWFPLYDEHRASKFCSNTVKPV